MTFLRVASGVSSGSWWPLAGLLVLGGIGGAIAFYLAFVRDLPDLSTVEDYRPPLASRVLDRNGEEIGEFFKERRTLDADWNPCRARRTGLRRGRGQTPSSSTRGSTTARSCGLPG